jgi:hypothetical protein
MMPRVSSFPFFCIVSRTLLWNRQLFPFAFSVCQLHSSTCSSPINRGECYLSPLTTAFSFL